MQRRQFLQSAVGLSAFFTGLHGCYNFNRDRPYAIWNWNTSTGGYGKLQVAGDALALPPNFQYRTLSIEGKLMSDGQPTPPLPDGMASFTLPNGNIRLIRNHEVGHNQSGINAHNITTAYDTAATGGATSLEINPVTREVIRDFVALYGTVRNCSGGATPWGSWLSCEETLSSPGNGLQKPHGYVFEVPALAEEPVSAQPIKALGRFVHESIAIDPLTGTVYQTEDTDQTGFYRFVPATAPAAQQQINFSAGGKLQALRVVDQPAIDLTRVTTAGATYEIDWVTIDNPDPDATSIAAITSDSSMTPVFTQGYSLGAAIFSRCEGCVVDGASVWFVATRAGHGHGQIWRLTPGADSAAILELMHVSKNKDVLSGPDNLCMSPQGALIICEDSQSDPKRVVAMTSDGSVIPIAENIIDDEEFAGATFSPDGKTLFVNIQGDQDDNLPGRTLAIWGPWENGLV